MRKRISKILKACWSEWKKNSFLHFLSFFVIVIFLIKIFFPSSCDRFGKDDVFSPSKKWAARSYQEVCGYIVPAEYAVNYVTLVPLKPRFFDSKDGRKIFSLDDSARLPNNVFVKPHWKDDRNLEIITNACDHSCLVKEKDIPNMSHQLCDSACKITTPVEGINVTLISAQKPN